MKCFPSVNTTRQNVQKPQNGLQCLEIVLLFYTMFNVYLQIEFGWTIVNCNQMIDISSLNSLVHHPEYQFHRKQFPWKLTLKDMFVMSCKGM